MDINVLDDLLECIDTSFSEVAEKLIGIQTAKCNHVQFENKYVSFSVLIELKGTDCCVILMTASINTSKKIAEAMNEGSFEDESDIPIYVAEFANIFCGNGTSSYSKKNLSNKIQISPPRVLRNNLPEKTIENKILRSNYYSTEYGIIRLALAQLSGSNYS